MQLGAESMPAVVAKLKEINLWIMHNSSYQRRPWAEINGRPRPDMLPQPAPDIMAAADARPRKTDDDSDNTVGQESARITLANGKGPGNYSCGGPGRIRRSAFHFTDPGGCAINDPNAPFYDSRTGIYHLFYQLHVFEDVNRSDCTSGGPGPVWGHSYSRDMVTWEPLPPALWNDQWYDRCAVYTGSA